MICFRLQVGSWVRQQQQVSRTLFSCQLEHMQFCPGEISRLFYFYFLIFSHAAFEYFSTNRSATKRPKNNVPLGNMIRARLHWGPSWGHLELLTKQIPTPPFKPAEHWSMIIRPQRLHQCLLTTMGPYSRKSTVTWKWSKLRTYTIYLFSWT